MSALREVVAAAEPDVAAHAAPDPGPGAFGAILDHRERLFALEAAYEGYLMHYGAPRAFAGMDEDLRLLAGDSLYALGLDRLAAAGDLEAVAELSDLISLCARVHAEGAAETAERLWRTSATALAGGGRTAPPGARPR